MRVKTNGVLMKNFSVSCGLANLSSFRKVSSFGLWTYLKIIFSDSVEWVINKCWLFPGEREMEYWGIFF